MAWTIRSRSPPAAGDNGRALPNLILAAALVALGLLVTATAVSVYAIFTGSTSVPNNDFASDTLDPPSGLGAPVSGADVNLSWTATVDTYASGHRVLRGTASGGPYSQIAEVTPRTTITYTDNPGDGTFYYVARAFYQSWESGNSNEATATVSTCTAGDTGFLNPTAQAADSGGDGDGFELNPSDAFTDGVASASNIDGDDDNHRFYNYGISIPAGCSTIAGIEVRLDWWLDAVDGNNKIEADLSWDGGTSWTAAKSDTQEPTTETTVILGGAADAWSRIWTIAELSDANFRVRVTTTCSGNPSKCSPRDYFLDWVPVKVFYTP